MRTRLLWFLPVLLLFLAGPPVRGEGVTPQIRVGLLQHVLSVTFSLPQGGSIVALTGDTTPITVPAEETWKAMPSTDGVKLFRADGSLAGMFTHGLIITPLEGNTTLVYGITSHWDTITDREYRGVIEIRNDGAGALTVINNIDIESYLRGVVPSEMPYTYPLAALQAQAVAARGEALLKAIRHEVDFFGLCATAHCQVYGGATSERSTTDEAVATTRGEVLTYDSHVANTLYSSNCGGHTSNNEDYWPGATPIPYLRGVPDFEPEDDIKYTFPLTEEQAARYLKYAPRVNCNQSQLARTDKIRWWSVVPLAEMEQKVESVTGDMGNVLDVRVTKRAESGMVTRLTIVGTKRLVTLEGGVQARRALGGLDSPSFALSPIRGKDGLAVAFAVWGAGWGHQVGLCQVGAAGLAAKGWEYPDILAKYYTGTIVESQY